MARTQPHTSPPRSRSLSTRPSPRALLAGGTDGNELLTVATGAVLIVLLAIIGLTIIALGRLLWVHLFVGMLLIGPLALKLASTGYRFMRYYSGEPRYRSAGPPITPLRLIAPMVVLTTLTVFASGVALLLAGPSSRPTLMPIHKVSFILWIAFTALHVLGHLPTLARGLQVDYGQAASLGHRTPGRSGRALSLAGALVAGGVLAILYIPQFAPWLHFHHH